MPLRIAATLAILMGVFLALSISGSSASAHSVSNRHCHQYAARNNGHNRAVKLRRYQACLDWRAQHNICHGVYRCKNWLLIAICESGNQREVLTERNIASIRWSIHNSYEGGMQFNSGTWDSTRSGYSTGYQAPPNAQLKAAERWRQLIGGNPHSSAGWPLCGRYW